ncbi:MAG TPA: hypothetical protein VFU88_12340 [Ktedonobacterales bacterium]|nr:hypothetical protein [Ktedonobacterales bacterium]
MSTSLTILHVRDAAPEEVERALAGIFAGEERAQALRLEGTYSAVLRRVTDPDLAAGYCYLILRPHAGSPWTPVLELGNRTVGLDAELSKALGGTAVFTTFVYGAAVSGYRLVREGDEVDRYLSDPTYFLELEESHEGVGPGERSEPLLAAVVEPERGHPERFADLLPAGTAPEDFWQVVLAPGWWEEFSPAGAAGEEEALVDEMDRMRCIGLALELWGPDDYPLAQEPEEIADKVAGPAIAVAFA